MQCGFCSLAPELLQGLTQEQHLLLPGCRAAFLSYDFLSTLVPSMAYDNPVS